MPVPSEREDATGWCQRCFKLPSCQIWMAGKQSYGGCSICSILGSRVWPGSGWRALGGFRCSRVIDSAGCSWIRSGCSGADSSHVHHVQLHACAGLIIFNNSAVTSQQEIKRMSGPVLRNCTEEEEHLKKVSNGISLCVSLRAVFSLVISLTSECLQWW